MNEKEKHIVAWSIAWEGTISLVRHGHRTSTRYQGYTYYSYESVVSLYNTDEELLKKFQVLVGCGKIRRSPQKGRKRDQFYWLANRRSVVEPLLVTLIPYFPAKKRQAELLLEYFSYFKLLRREKERERIWREMRKLNQKGKH